MAYCQLTLEDIGICAYELEEFHSEYQPFFSTPNADDWSKKYLHSTFVCPERRNIANRAKAVPGGDSQNMHHFISNAEWADYPVICQIQQDVNNLIGDSEQGALIVDGSGIPKKGDHSVGVGRQYCGALGKVDNCQVGVFLAYSNDTDCTLIDSRLYIPEDWFYSPERLHQAGVPKDVTFQKKGELALSMIRQALNNNVQFSFIGGDSVYGDSPWFRDALDDLEEIYCLEVSCDTTVWLSRKLAKEGTRRRRADEIAEEFTDEEWQRVFVRDGEKKPLEWEFCALKVLTPRDDSPPKEEWLIIRRSLDKKSLKFALSNAPQDTPLEIHAERMCRRYWVERSIQIGKGAAGLDEYEVRGWRGWHHHMTMTLLAMLFLLQLRVKLQDKAPLLTIEDVVDILETVLPIKVLTHQEAIEFIEQKHKARIASKESHHRRYNKEQANQTRASPKDTES